MGWRVVAASATGRAHLDRNLPCQDAFASTCVGEVLVAAVCDGAGSASHSDAGARLVAAQVVATLAGQPSLQGDPAGLGVEAVRPLVEGAIALAREQLAVAAAAQRIRLVDFACTLVGVIANAEGGWFFHLGDGVAACEFRDETQPNAVSLPANGEYANETWFVTGGNWREQVRLTRFEGQAQAVVLMFDGAQPFAMNREGTQLFQPFFAPVQRYLRGVDVAHGNQALAATLADPRTDHITGDDKTLLIALPD